MINLLLEHSIRLNHIFEKNQMIRGLLSNRTRLFVFNTSTNLSTHFVAVIVGVIMLPLKLDYFGVKLFGLFILLTSLTSYVQKIDFGVGTTIQRYTAKLSAEKNYDEISRLMGFTLLFNLLYGLIIGFCILILGCFSDIIFSLSETDFALFQQLAYIIASRTIISWPLSTFITFLSGMQLYFVTNALKLINVFGELIIIIFAMRYDWTIFTYVIYVSILGLFTKFMGTLFARYKFAFIRPSRFHLKEIREYLYFSWHMVKSQVASLMQFETDRILIGIFLNPASLTFYHIGEKLHGTIRKVFNNFTKSLMPLMSEKYASNEKGYLDRAIYDGSRIFSIIGYPVIITLMINTKYILTIWLGDQYSFLYLFASAFLLPYLVTLPSSILSRVLVGSGNIKKYMNIRMIAALCNLMISIILIQPLGIWGVLVGTLFQSFLFNIYFYRIFFKLINIEVSKFIKKVIFPCCIVSFASILSSILLRLVWVPNTVIDLIIFLFFPVFFGYLAAALFNRDDVSTLKRIVYSN